MKQLSLPAKSQSKPRYGCRKAAVRMLPMLLGCMTAVAQQQFPAAPTPAPQVEPGFSSPAPDLPTLPCCQPDACSPADARMTCSAQPVPFARYMQRVDARALTPKYKLRLALRNAVDPFNLLTIVGTSAITVADNADSPYGPGFDGFAKNAGVAFTQELTSQFFGTFLIPSLAHQDPHYYRTPNAPLRHRIWHSIYQVVWTVDDDGKPMFNYANVFGSIAEDAISDIYVPGRHTDPGASAARISIGLATGPTDNLITEFLPDVANKVNFHVVFVQRIINRVAIGPSVAP